MVPQTSPRAERDKKIPKIVAGAVAPLIKVSGTSRPVRDGIPVTDWLTRVGPYSQLAPLRRRVARATGHFAPRP